MLEIWGDRIFTTDISQVLGLKGKMAEVTYDVSVAFARDTIEYHLNNTINASMGSASPTGFEIGSLIQTEKNLNADFTYPLSEQLALAAGVEWRQEQYEIKGGDVAAYQVGSFPTLGIGSNGLPGYSPSQQGSFKRENYSVYIDSEYNVSETFQVGAALRDDYYSDFGNTVNGKLSGRYHLNNQFTLRSSLGTGFRAPTPAQIFVTNIAHAPTTLGAIRAVGLIPSTNEVAKFLGGKALTPEKSQNFSLGLSFQQEALHFSVDFFLADVADRIAFSPNIVITEYCDHRRNQKSDDCCRRNRCC